LAPELQRLGILTVLDRGLFAGYCQAYARWREYSEIVAREGATIPGHRGVERKHPLLPALAAAMQTVRALAAEFGLTPASRARLNVPAAPEAESEWENLLD